MIHHKYILIACVFLFSGCSSVFNVGQSGPDVLLRSDFNGDGIAVLTFSAQGSFLRSDAGIIAADRFAEEMFLRRRYNVIDRSRVNNVVNDLNIRSGEILSDDQIREIGRRLEANYVVVGKIYQEAEPFQFTENINKKLIVSMRIIDTESTDMVGIARYSVAYKNDFHDIIKRAANRITRRMR
jgi:TolB-like protein